DLDCVAVGIHKKGNNTFNRNWQIAQGSIIANAGEPVENIHPIIIEGEGHTAITNVEAFSGGNPALTTVPENQSWNFLEVRGDKRLTVTLFGSRMRSCASEDPTHVHHKNAGVQAVACVDKNEKLYNHTLQGKQQAEMNKIPSAIAQQGWASYPVGKFWVIILMGAL